MDDNKNEILLSWVTPEHVHHNRTIDFYWALGLITLACAVLAFILRDGLFGALILICGGMYGYISWHKPKNINVSITNKEITVEDEIYLISKINAYRIMDIKGDKELILQIILPYQPMVSVCIPNEIAYQVKNVLSTMLTEDEKLIPHIGRRFMIRYKI